MRVLILGNGFDISHGLPTKWVDFQNEIEASEENQDYINLSRMIKKYKLDKNYNLWSDVEKALGKMWSKENSEEMDKFLDLFTICFQKYLKENVNENIRKSANNDLIEFFKSFDHIINFNYTGTLERLYGINEKVWHIHGRINDDTLEKVHVVIGCDKDNEHCMIDNFNGEMGISKSNLICRKIFNKFRGGMKQASNYEATYALFELEQNFGFIMAPEDYEQISVSSWGFSFSESDNHFINQMLSYPNVKIDKIYSYQPELGEYPSSDLEIVMKFGVSMSKAINHMAYSEDLLNGIFN